MGPKPGHTHCSVKGRAEVILFGATIKMGLVVIVNVITLKWVCCPAT